MILQMGRKYVRRTEKNSWSEDTLKKALKAIQDRQLSIRKAGLQFDIPESTLRKRMKEGSGCTKHVRGCHQPIITFVIIVNRF